MQAQLGKREDVMLDWAIRAKRMGGRLEESAPSKTDLPSGLVAGTMVATIEGWVPVEQICVGDKVVTFDDGAREVTGVTRRLFPLRENDAVQPLLSLPVGLVGNQRRILLPEAQAMIVESDLAEQILDDPFAAVQAAALAVLPGVEKGLPDGRVVVVTVSFEEDQMIFVEGQALAYCAAARRVCPQSLEEAIWTDTNQRYTVLSGEEAELVVSGMLPQARSREAQGPTIPGPQFL
ncbi:Hint domain-containing protein [Tropicimonas sp. TH_r6]|uniref:Hint domain-containing protein n=1 Tax=Tropicimonas sp. TH_r6 TaxID=3082085 RepID=UPI002953B60B|nr:Hint domain-containing protein [Tropicimonas sp. TH_r6]MDV7142188.1 Hint domain-containing protein [Tropicimonas sp. TH_r6]